MPMTNDCAMLSLTMVLKFRKQMAILTTARRQEAKCIFGGNRLAGSGLVCVGSSVGAAVTDWFFSQRKLGHNEIYSH